MGSLKVPRPPPSGSISKRGRLPERASDLKKKRGRLLAGPRISKKKEVAALGRLAGAGFPATSFLFDEKRYRYIFSLRAQGPDTDNCLSIYT